MKIKEIENNKKRERELYNKWSVYSYEIDHITYKIKNSDLSSEELNKLTNRLIYIKEELKNIEKERKNIKNNLIDDWYVVNYNREMLGNEVAKLISLIYDKKYIYKEDYLYSIKSNVYSSSSYPKNIIAKNKIFTVIEKGLENHDIYMEYYDLEDFFQKNDEYKFCDDDEYDYKSKNEFINRIENNQLFVLPDNNYFLYRCEEDIKNYLNGNIKYSIYTCGNIRSKGKNISYIDGYYDSKKGYNKFIDDFLVTVFLKGIYENKELNQKEIEMIRNKFIELYKNGYSFDYFEKDKYLLDRKLSK